MESDQAEGQEGEHHPGKHPPQEGTPATEAEGPEAESPKTEDGTKVDTQPENNKPRGPVETNTNFETMRHLTQSPTGKETEATAQRPETTITEATGDIRPRRKPTNVFERLTNLINDAGSPREPPDEDELTFLADGIKEEDWTDRGDTGDTDAERFLSNWTRKVQGWNLSPKAAEKLMNDIGKRDSRNTNQMIIHKMPLAVKKAYPTDQMSGAGRQGTTKRDNKDKAWEGGSRETSEETL